MRVDWTGMEIIGVDDTIDCIRQSNLGEIVKTFLFIAKSGF